MALRVLTLSLTGRRLSNVNLGSRASVHVLRKIGKREIVGSGINNTECYLDHVAFPMPAIRFREPTPESLCLQAKEELNWNKLTMSEKKALYRYSFCQTFSEMKADSGQWKVHVTSGIMAVTVAIWVIIIYNIFLYEDLPETFDEEHQKAQLKRILILEMNPVTGLSSKWDYENNKWK